MPAKTKTVADEKIIRKHTSADRFFGWHTIFGVHGEHRERYMTRIWLGRLRLHIFYRGDNDPDPHDHPWSFWTFPLTSYVEEVTEQIEIRHSQHVVEAIGETFDFGYTEKVYQRRRQVVPAFRWSFRPAEHTHRVLGPYAGRVWNTATQQIVDRVEPHTANMISIFEPYYAEKGKIVTIVWNGMPERKWGFLKNRDGQWCWVPWRQYVFGDGKSAPCE